MNGKSSGYLGPKSSQNSTNGSEFSTFESKGSWTDNFGNYGKNLCKGVIDKGINKDVSLIVMCESIDKNGYKTWALNKRDGEFVRGIGACLLYTSDAADE